MKTGSNVEKLCSLKEAKQSVLFVNGREDLYVMPATAGYSYITEQPYRWHGRQRGKSEFVLFQYTISGEGILDFEGKQIALTPGSAMLLRIPHNHCYYIGKKHWEFFWIVLEGSEVVRIFEDIIYRHGPVHTFKPELIEKLAEICVDTVLGKHSSIGLASSAAYAFSMHLFDYFNQSSGPQEQYIERLSIASVLNYIDSNLSSDLQVDTLAKISGYNRYHFSRQFRKATGKSPAEFVLNKRLNRALSLLKKTGHTVKQISILSGFNDPSYFAKVFRNHFGFSPRDYREDLSIRSHCSVEPN